MVDIDDLLPDVMLYAPSVPEPVAHRFIRSAAREFCQRTKVWAEWDQITITGDSDGEFVTTIPDADIFEIEAANLTNADGGKFVLEPVTPKSLDVICPRWKYDFDDNAAPGRYITQIRPDTVMVIPKDTGTLDVRLILRPSKHAMSVPDFLSEKYSEEIAKGAAGRILILPTGDFTNPQLGAGLLAEFRNLCDSMAISSQLKQIRARPRTRSAFF